MKFHEILKERRTKLKLGVRETARLTEKPYVPFPIKSAIYISRLENQVVEEMKAESVSIDKLWALGVALQVSPLVLFSYSRSLPDMLDCIAGFNVRECEPMGFSLFIKVLRTNAKLTLREVASDIEKVSPWPISMGYLSQLETDDDNLSERVSGEKLWALGRFYDVDPLLLYVLSRKIDQRFLKASARDMLFS